MTDVVELFFAGEISLLRELTKKQPLTHDECAAIWQKFVQIINEACGIPPIKWEDIAKKSRFQFISSSHFLSGGLRLIIHDRLTLSYLKIGSKWRLLYGQSKVLDLVDDDWFSTELGNFVDEDPKRLQNVCMYLPDVIKAINKLPYKDIIKQIMK